MKTSILVDKLCRTCRCVKDRGCFNTDKGKKDGLMSRCKECVTTYQKQWNTANAEHKELYERQYHLEHREKRLIKGRNKYALNKESLLRRQREKYRQNTDYYRNIDLMKHYGITLQQYNDRLKNQNYVCAICKKPETVLNARSSRVKNLAVDHCHATGKIRGLLCTNCNRALGNLKDSFESANNLVAYLKDNDHGS